MCTMAGFEISQVTPRICVGKGGLGMLFGFGFGGLLIAIDEMLKGFSLRAFSATTFGLFLGMVFGHAHRPFRDCLRTSTMTQRDG